MGPRVQAMHRAVAVVVVRMLRMAKTQRKRMNPSGGGETTLFQEARTPMGQRTSCWLMLPGSVAAYVTAEFENRFRQETQGAVTLGLVTKMKTQSAPPAMGEVEMIDS
mmetsp:Transcript_47099/g.54566  ORF Transcript_47099/g.54566 Transcript_47099/m.54566 type:complete len:108 (+) Transcript_47099:478-801(+)